MSANEVNVPLLRKAVEWAEAEAAKPGIDCGWEQSAWMMLPLDRAWDLLDEVEDQADEAVEQVSSHCGTAYCIAGYTAQMLDARYATEHDVDDVHLSVFAARALGIPESHALAQEGSLFYGFNSIEDVRRIAEDLAGERL